MSNKIISKLVKLAETQQKIISKLAQTVSELKDGQADGMKPNQATLDPADLTFKALDAVTQGTVALTNHLGNVLATFKPGQKTQKNYDAVKKAFMDLKEKGSIVFTCELEVA